MQSKQIQPSYNNHRKPARGWLAGAVVLLAVLPGVKAQNGTWTNFNTTTGAASGSWAAATNWNGSVIASGANNTANFATLTFGANSTVTLDAAWTIGNLIFANVTPSATATNWLVNASTAGTTTPATDFLTLADGGGTPVISVTNAVATINAGLFSTSGFSLTGGGTLRLNGANTNANGYLTGPIYVNQGILQMGNASALGAANPTNAAYATNGGTIELISAIAVNNEVLYAGGTGNGGTNGVLYANNPTSAGSTRWGLSTFNSSGISANSSVAAPAVIMTTNLTIRVDGAATGSFSNEFLLGYIASSTNGVATVTNSFYTLTKTGTGRLEFERGALVSNVLVQAGSVFPDSANAFNSVQQWTVRSGAAILNNQNETFNATTISLQIDAGGVYDVNFRGNATPGSDANVYVQNLGTLTGAGTITCGERGEIDTQTLNITSTNYSYFSGWISDTNGDALALGKTGAGSTLRLSGTNSYHGATTVSGAGSTLLVDGTELNGSNYLVNSGAFLGGTGNISATIQLNGGTLVAGDGGGTLTVGSVISTGGDTTIVSNANLTVNGTLGSLSSGYLSTLYLSNATLQLPLQSSGPAAYIATLNNDGKFLLAYTTANPSAGQFPLIAYQGIGGLAGGGTAGITLVPPAGTVAYLSNNVANSTLDVVVTGIPALVWQGTPSGTWSIGGSANWFNGTAAASYTESGGAGPFVIFNDTAPGTTTVNITTTVSPKGITVNNSGLNYTNTGTGAVGGTGGLLKQGTGSLVLANSGSNYFGGTLAIQGGTVQVGNGGTAGNLGTGPVANGGQLTFDRSDNITVPNVISGGGALVKAAAGSATLTGITNYGGVVSINGGALDFATGGTITFSNNVVGSGELGVDGGTVVLESPANTWAGGTLISAGTLQVGDVTSSGSLPGAVVDNGTLAFGTYATVTNNISGLGGLLLPDNTGATLGGLNTYSGPTVVLDSTLTAAAANYPAGSVLTLGNQAGTGEIGNANFTAGNPVIGGLNAGGNTATPDQISFNNYGQVLTINGNVSVGSTMPTGASVWLQPAGSGVTVVINTNGGTFQIGLGNSSSGVNPDNVEVDFSQIDNLVVNLGATGVINLGTLDGNPGPQAGATVVNELLLANISNSITAGTIVIGAGGRQLTPDLYLGPGTNIINVGTLDIATGGRDGGDLAFNPNNSSAGGVTIGGLAGGSTRAEYNQGVGTSGSSAGFTSVVDFTGATAGGPGGTANLLFDAMVIGNVPDRTASGLELGWSCTFNFGAGTLNANSVSLSAGCYPGAAGSSTMTISGGTASLGAVSLTESTAPGTLNITGATVTVSNITYTAGLGTATLSLDNATLNVALGASGNPSTAPVAGGSFSASDTVNLGFSGSGFTPGQFPLISYTGSIGGGGFPSLNLASLPAGVAGYLSNNTANSSVDVVITAAPPTVDTNPTNITAQVTGSTLDLAWPADHTGWRLEVETNSLATGLSTGTNNWTTVPGSSSVNSISLPVNPALPTVFYRLVYP